MVIRNQIPSMKIWSLLLLFGALPLLAQAPMSEAEARSLYETRNKEIQRLWHEKQWDNAVPILQEIVASPAMMRVPEIRFEARYNLACGYSLLGQKEKSMTLLREIVADTVVDPTQIERDTDFDNIRSEPAYKEILAAARTHWAFWDSPALGTPFKENLSEDEKISGLARFWSEARYNFAWFEKVPDLDWDAKMIEYLPRVRSTKSTLEYYRVLMEFAALLKDAHTNVSPPRKLQDEFWSRPAIGTTLVEGRVLVTRVLGDEALAAAGVRRGVELIAVDGLPVREYAARFVMPLLAVSTEQDRESRAFAARGLLGGPPDSKVRLQFRDESGRTFEVTAARLTPSELEKRDTAPPKPRFEYRLLDDGCIAYVALNTFAERDIVTDFEKAWPELRKAPAMILDIRANGGGNSGFGDEILSYLVVKGGDVEAVRLPLYRPTYRAWGRLGHGEDWESRTWTVDAKPGQGYSGPIILLTGPGTFSAAEDFTVSFDMLKAGIILGEPTAGSTGQPLEFRLPGGGSARVCTLQCRYADGREFVAVGVQPKIRVSPTVADFRVGKDTVLEYAEAYLRGHAPSK